MGNNTSSSSASAPTVSTADPNAVLQVKLDIVSATGIMAGDYFGLTAAMRGQLSSSDAYAVIEVEGVKVAWTRPIFNTLEPVWNETFFFTNVHVGSLCRLYLIDKDIDADDELGDTQFVAFDTQGMEQQFELPITYQNKSAGKITVKVQSHRVELVPGPVREFGPVRYSTHASVTAGLMTGSFTDDAKLQSMAYQVQLHNVPEFLSNEVEWNKNYPTIQPIFSPDSNTGPVLRKALSTQHAMIYKHDPNTTYGTLASGMDFLKLINNGRRLGKPVLYTYVIKKKNQGWYFSETGAAFFKDMLSKHMLHASCNYAVLYAGEFHVQETPQGAFKLVIDNNSGTYAPPKAFLPQLQALFENNFPGIPIEALDRDDANLQQSRDEILKAWA